MVRAGEDSPHRYGPRRPGKLSRHGWSTCVAMTSFRIAHGRSSTTLRPAIDHTGFSVAQQRCAAADAPRLWHRQGRRWTITLDRAGRKPGLASVLSCRKPRVTVLCVASRSTTSCIPAEPMALWARTTDDRLQRTARAFTCGNSRLWIAKRLRETVAALGALAARALPQRQLFRRLPRVRHHTVRPEVAAQMPMIAPSWVDRNVRTTLCHEILRANPDGLPVGPQWTARVAECRRRSGTGSSFSNNDLAVAREVIRGVLSYESAW